MYFIFQKIIQYIFYMLNIVQYIGDYNLQQYSINFLFTFFFSYIAHLRNESINEWIKNEKRKERSSLSCKLQVTE